MKHESISQVVILLCAIVNFLIFVKRIPDLRAARRSRESCDDPYSYVGDDFPEHIQLPRPPREDVVTTFEYDSFPISGEDAASQWQSIYPPGYGFVRLGDSSRLLCVAMFHELHCIEKMRIWLDDPFNPEASAPHLHHCMNYLRQLFLCGADLTLEPIDMEGDAVIGDDTDLSTRSGRSLSRACGDSAELYDVASENYLKWKASWNISSPWEGTHTHGGHNHGL
ncbi:hypothetical protein OF83DRAFT_1087560 [Amylostereum chailletii]|nr:hypothetical protein OF83DRAFT_1087560 [Amylostereum chailletii]